MMEIAEVASIDAQLQKFAYFILSERLNALSMVVQGKEILMLVQCALFVKNAVTFAFHFIFSKTIFNTFKAKCRNAIYTNEVALRFPLRSR